MLETLADGLALSLNPINRRATLNLKNARPNHTLVLQGSEDLRHWTPLSTNTPTAIADWLFLDMNAPPFRNGFTGRWDRGNEWRRRHLTLDPSPHPMRRGEATPHAGFPPERAARLELAVGAKRGLPVANRPHAFKAFTRTRQVLTVAFIAPSGRESE